MSSQQVTRTGQALFCLSISFLARIFPVLKGLELGLRLPEIELPGVSDDLLGPIDQTGMIVRLSSPRSGRSAERFSGEPRRDAGSNPARSTSSHLRRSGVHITLQRSAI